MKHGPADPEPHDVAVRARPLEQTADRLRPLEAHEAADPRDPGRSRRYAVGFAPHRCSSAPISAAAEPHVGRRPARYAARHALRRTFPLEVRGREAGRINSTAHTDTSKASDTAARMAPRTSSP